MLPAVLITAPHLPTDPPGVVLLAIGAAAIIAAAASCTTPGLPRHSRPAPAPPAAITNPKRRQLHTMKRSRKFSPGTHRGTITRATVSRTTHTPHLRLVLELRSPAGRAKLYFYWTPGGPYGARIAEALGPAVLDTIERTFTPPREILGRQVDFHRAAKSFRLGPAPPPTRPNDTAPIG
jgi:hypothetical protein